MRSVHPGQQEDGHDCRVPEVGLEEIADDEADRTIDASTRRAALGLRDEPRVEFDADTARAEHPGCRDRDAPVPGAEVVDHVSRSHLGQLQHRLHDVLRRGEEANVRSSRGRDLRAARRSEEEAQQGDNAADADDADHPG